MPQRLQTGSLVTLEPVNGEGTLIRATVASAGPLGIELVVQPMAPWLAPGRDIRATCIQSEGVDSFLTRVLRRSGTNDGVVTVASPRGSIRRERRRELRSTASLPVTANVLDHGMRLGPPMSATSIDVSLRGVRLRAPKLSVGTGDLLVVSIDLPGHPVRAVATALGADDVPDEVRPGYSVLRLTFVSMDDESAAHLAAFLACAN